MRLNILSAEQKEIIPLVQSFGDKFYLVGGTSLALQYGHRRSIDFDLFSKSDFDADEILAKTSRDFVINETYVSLKNELTIKVNGVKFTWYKYDFEIEKKIIWPDVITMPDPLHIAAMKAFALGRRAKWKDYVDLYFVLQRHLFAEVVFLTTKIFGAGLFNERLFREQLAYYQDIDYTEEVDFMTGFAVSKSKIKKFLTKLALS